MTDIIYPPGCRPLSEDLGTDELIRRLKNLANTLQSMGQDSDTHQQYTALALQLVEDFYIKHPSKDVQLLTACCIADLLRFYAPEAPFKDQDQIKTIFMFFIKQLYGLNDIKDPSFKRYFYLLENLAYVKSFNMCFDLEDSQKVFYELFGMIFKILGDHHSVKVKNYMLDILSPLIKEADNFTIDLLDIILINIVEPHKSKNKVAYHFAEELIVKTADSLEPIIKMFFNQVLVMDKADTKYAISSKVYDLIYELYKICPDILCSILPQLECKLKATNEAERAKAVSLVARMFSEKDSQLSKKHPALLKVFLGRFCDIAVLIRVKCVQSTMHFLLNHPHLRQDIIQMLRNRQHDSNESVRYEVVISIVETAKRNFKIVCENLDLLEFVRERTLDKMFKIRKDAMSGLAFVYKQAWCEPNDLMPAVKKSVDWLKNKVLHGYYMVGIEDRLLVERLLITCLVPYKLPPVERMKALYHLLGTLDENATRAFVEMQKSQMKMRKTIGDWVKLHHIKELTPKLQSQLNVKLTIISKLLPEPKKSTEYLKKFSVAMRTDAQLLSCMETVLKRDISCKECADTMSAILKKLGQPVANNPYYSNIKMLVERIASVMVDTESIGVLIGLIEECMQRNKMVEEVGIPRQEAGERGLKLLTVLSYVFSAHFFTENTLRHMIALLSYEEDYAAPLLLKCFTNLGRYKPLCEANPIILDELAPVCKEFALSGTVKQAKNAIRCIFVNSQDRRTNNGINQQLAAGPTAATSNSTQVVVHPIFHEIIEALRTTLYPKCENQHTKIVTLGHIAYNMPQAFLTPIKNMIARRIVKELLIQGVEETREDYLPESDWCAEDELPADTQCKLDALKTMARWLLGLRSDVHSAQKTFRMLTAFMSQRGDLLEQNRLCAAEKSWLRLGAACAMLKICEQKDVGNEYSAEQFFSLSQLMFDPVVEVREAFVRKLHKGLGKCLPNQCLTIDFMGFYALAGHETDRKLIDLIKRFIEADISRRREYIKTVTATTTTAEHPNPNSEFQLLQVLPDFMLAFAVPILVHDPAFTDHEDLEQLKMIERCLRFILDPLMAKQDAFSFSFYKNLIQMMKNHQDITEDNGNNLKLWATCDLALYVIYSKMKQCDTTASETIFSSDMHLPVMFFKPGNISDNTTTYIPLDVFSLLTPNSKIACKKNVFSKTASTTMTTPTSAAAELTVAVGDKRKANDLITINENSPTNAQDTTVYDGLTNSEHAIKRPRPGKP